MIDKLSKLSKKTIRDIIYIQYEIAKGETQNQIHKDNPELITHKTYKKYCDRFPDFKERHEQAIKDGRELTLSAALADIKDSERDFYEDNDGNKKINPSAVRRDEAYYKALTQKYAQSDSGRANGSNGVNISVVIDGQELDDLI